MTNILLQNTPGSSGQANRIRSALAAQFTLVDKLDDADVILALRLSSESSGSGGYQVGTATGSAVGDHASVRNTRIGGDVSGANVVIDSEQTVSGNIDVKMGDLKQQVSDSDSLSPESKSQLNALLEQLQTALRQLPPDHAEDAEVISEEAEDTVKEGLKAQPRAGKLAINAQGLIQAAKNVAAITPPVLLAATQIANFIELLIRH